MNSFKLLVVFILLLLGSFAQRFQRHLFDGTQNGYINGDTEMDTSDSLSSDGDNYEQYGKDVKFIRDGEEAELELENKELMFKFCSDGCMDQKVIVCYDAEDPFLKEGCSSNQCVFQAGVEKEGGASSLRKNLLWLMTTGNGIRFNDNNEKCATVVIKSPEATAEGFQPFPSCNPKKYDGKVIKLRVSGVKPGCPFYVLNAKKWVPPPPTTSATQNSTELSQTTKPSEANTTLWIGIGVGIFILLIVVIGFGRGVDSGVDSGVGVGIGVMHRKDQRK
uniref:Transmembrane protein n=1 Tax=Panagrolaimus davidi TaxID=227884 RepID=A0A914QUJ6_9BILA